MEPRLKLNKKCSTMATNCGGSGLKFLK